MKMIVDQLTWDKNAEGKYVSISWQTRKGARYSSNPATSRINDVKVYQQEHLGEHCAYTLLARYLRLRRGCNHPRLWLAINTFVSEGGLPFMNSPMGENTIRRHIKEITVAAGISSHIVPHSFRSSGITAMVTNHVDPILGMLRTGHKTVRAYSAYVAQNAELQFQVDLSISKRLASTPGKEANTGTRSNTSSASSAQFTVGTIQQLFINTDCQEVTISTGN